MITRQNIIEELLKMQSLDRESKKEHIAKYLGFNDVTEDEKEKILSDLESYEQF